MADLSAISMVLGALIVCLTMVDLFTTVFVIGGGAGYQSRWVADRLWRLALRLHKPKSERSHSLMRGVGPMILLTALLIWIVELTLGWALVFVPEAFSNSDVGFGDRLAFAARTVAGRGGNLPPLESSSGLWELLLIPAGLTGVAIVSLGLAYVLPILAAVTHKRSIAATIYSLGGSAESIRAMVQRSGEGSLDPHLVTIIPALALSAERHRSYPVLHYFHSRDHRQALAPAVATLSLLLRDGMPPGAQDVDATVSEPLARITHDLLEALCSMGLQRYAENEMGAKDLEPLGLDASESSPAAFPSEEWLRAYVAFDGWEWEKISPQEGSE